MDDLYQQEILDHYHNPQNYGAIDNADTTIEETNASCGDSFTFYVVIDNQKSKIKNLKFTGTGCAISTAASSMLTEHLKDKPVSEIKNINSDFMQELIGVEITPSRLKCLMLPVKAMNKLLIDIQ